MPPKKNPDDVYCPVCAARPGKPCEGRALDDPPRVCHERTAAFDLGDWYPSDVSPEEVP